MDLAAAPSANNTPAPTPTPFLAAAATAAGAVPTPANLHLLQVPFSQPHVQHAEAASVSSILGEAPSAPPQPPPSQGPPFSSQEPPDQLATALRLSGMMHSNA